MDVKCILAILNGYTQYSSLVYNLTHANAILETFMNGQTAKTKINCIQCLGYQWICINPRHCFGTTKHHIYVKILNEVQYLCLSLLCYISIFFKSKILSLIKLGSLCVRF